MKIGFTGTQKGMSNSQSITLHMYLGDHEDPQGEGEFHHGDCLGADEQAHFLAKYMRYVLVVHPPCNPAKRAWCRGDETRIPKEYLIRNHDIVDEVDVLVAAPSDEKNEEVRSGTWATIRYARKKGVPVLILKRDETGYLTNDSNVVE